MVNFIKKNTVRTSYVLIVFLFATGCNKTIIAPDDDLNETIDYFVSSLDTSLVHREDAYEAIFIENISFLIDSEQYQALNEISLKVIPKEGSALVDTFKVAYSKKYIESNNFLDTALMQITCPVFGLYDASINRVLVSNIFSNGKKWENTIQIETKQHPYTDSDNMEILSPTTDFDKESYMFLETDYGPMIMDIEGNIRWAAEEFISNPTTPSVFFENHLYCKKLGSPFNTLLKLGFDGTQESVTLECGNYPGAAIHHEMNCSPNGFLLELNIKNGTSVEKKCSVLIEVDKQGKLLQTWDMDEIIGKCLSGSGVPVDTFIRNSGNSKKAIDWFHMNSSIYDQSDNTVLISSRENFVIKVGYNDKEIKWILGDTTKYWYTLDTLKQYALNLTEGNINIGQHALSLIENGDLLLFNNGENSSVAFFPFDKLGATYSKSMISGYAISEQKKQASEVLNFELPYICPNRGCVNKSGDKFIVNYLPVETDYNSIIGIYDKAGNALLEIKNYSYFSVRAYGFPNCLNF